jgi:catechol 2,3-dioxygenase-like lactoylglutathione lyase family enzyme
MGPEPHVGRGPPCPEHVVTAALPKLDRVLETALYVDNLAAAARFYEQVMDLAPLTADDRFRAYDIGGKSVLLLFQRGSTLETVHMPGGTIPPHDGHGPVHIAFGVAAEDLPEWERRLGHEGVTIEGRTDWPRGGRSVYFRDLDAHLLELATPGLWTIY